MADIRLKLFEMLMRQKLLGKGLKARKLVPQIVSFAITGACNLKCPHCHANAKKTATSSELSMKEMINAINQMADLGTEALIFSGGEPLLKKNVVLNLTEHCSDLGIIPAMLTNGILLDYKTAIELKDAGMLAVGIPLDFASPQRHDEFRGLPGTFSRAVNAIKACLNADLKVVVTTMAMNSNFEEIPKLLHFLAKLGVENVVLYDFIATGRGRGLVDAALSGEKWSKLLNYIYLVQLEGDVFFLVSGGNPLYPGFIIEKQRSHETRPPDKLLRQFMVHSKVGCHAALHYLSLRPNGDVYPCPFLQINAGNIREKSLFEIWHSSEVFKMLRNRKLLKGKCGGCEYREICGGCRARAYVKTGDFMEQDPNCPFELFETDKVPLPTIEEFGICVG